MAVASSHWDGMTWPSTNTLLVLAVFFLSGAVGIGLFRVVVRWAVSSELVDEIERLERDRLLER